ncbi:hypothetical protein CHLNCDRAFT_143159 [Chlorella variabilis]|uniref:Nematode resistance protein-like HSPRO1 N-terminal domain-containing protein n=1 Tax=Chlorella variabilis TaxID=554065 RepID=E1Z9L4_CHLVA|nr:hypothetical protein CHLNCDRAFT_143159 [Chlorella variabilis]EFN57798.1 hypothetical protein CHLNCDRAFT_143159 [Chlorella variabilis]|eukprot:XP_005849900.1 hypothetical protein CHLNCDRAFT_143159 [Chlorella variabilis]
MPNKITNRGGGGAPGAGGKQLRLPSGRARIRLLYEEYVHLPMLRQVWEAPSTEKPVLEPLFAAGFHGIELALLLLAEFVSDGRRYVAKRPRELVAEDIATQCQLLTEVVDAELEEELGEGASPASRLSLTQAFPFEGCPPTKHEPCHSPGLQRLTVAIDANIDSMSSAERNSLIKLVLNITAALSSFQRWTVGLGIEPQLNSLRAAVGLPALQFTHTLNLDYDSLVKPWLCEQTLTCETYTHAEDFFFRTIHLGTDCWAFVALSRLRSAQQCAEAGNWHVAAARATQASRILQYLGSHVMLLTSMNLWDYLLLKVELEGTSGEGSVQVKSFRPTVRQLFEPLAAAALGVGGATAAAAAAAACSMPGEGQQEQSRQELIDQLEAALMEIYEWPDRQPGKPRLYNYCKALEAVETGLLGGFFYRHFCLATNVIGSEARGTMKRAVAALKAGYEAPVFPLLDRCRVALGARIDAEVAHNKGRMMDGILAKYQAGQQEQGGSRGCPFAPPSPAPGTPARSGPAAGTCPAVPGATGSGSPAGTAAPDEFEAARRQLYSWEGVPLAFRQMVAGELASQVAQLGLVPRPSLGAASAAGGGRRASAKPLAFLDHAWGQLAPLAQYRAWREAAALYELGNPAWDAMFGRVAAAHIRGLLGLPADGAACTVQFGSNSHELVSRLLSAFMDRRRVRSGASAAPAAEHGGNGAQGRAGAEAPPIRVLTSGCEFYSVTRQLNRFTEACLAEVEVVPAEPAATFAERCCASAAAAAAAGRRYDAIYLSQITYLTQQCLLPSVPDLVRRLRAVVGPEVLLIVDGYHGFCAVPTDLGQVAGECCYVAGMLKHAGCGANCAFMTLPARLDLKPVLTGWLADPSVLAPGSGGIQIGSEVGFCPDLALQGGTPSYLLPLLTFNHLMQLWQEVHPAKRISVDSLHGHVMRLHESFLRRLDAAGHPAINTRTLLPPQDPTCRSHTLVFAQPDAAVTKAVVEALAARGVQVDCRKNYLRIGFGANHGMDDVDALLTALQGLAAPRP